VPGGWRINGRKVWTTNAHICEYMIALVRTTGTPQDRQRGMSQFLIDLRTKGVEVRAINDLTTEAHFNEVTFEDVFVDGDSLVGAEGQGWDQANAELAFERSGPDRYMSVFPLLPLLLDTLRNGTPDRLDARKIGEVTAELAVLRQMSVSVAGMLAEGEAPNLEASVVKELGVALEQRVPDLVRELAGSQPVAGTLAEMHSAAMQLAPTFSLRGGTREIIRGIMARGLGLR
jgi:alkylation response protein AidB-like acyl-CoA dehydrogenase